ncbi:MAG TPA: hypothetical protein VN750_10995 [Steroidobacteraceae bacterium]|nr:hypothetical protein [Steroidobacteraceae bacterium]
MKTYFLVEPNKQAAEHLSFNVAIVRSLLTTARSRGDKVVLFCERRHREQIAAALVEADHGLLWEEIPVVSGLRRRFLWKFLVEWPVMWRVLRRAKREGATVVVLSLFANVLPFVTLARRLFRGTPTHLFLHGELESLLIAEKQPIYREGFWVKLALMRLYDGSWPTLYVLGAGIKRRLLQRYPDAAQLQAIRVIDHPYSFIPSSRRAEQPAQPAIRLGFVGAGREMKGVVEFFSLAQSLSEYVAAGRLEFVLVGGLEDRCRKFDNGWVKVLADEIGGLDAEEFRRTIASLDSALFLYRQNYALTASGAVFDVISEGVEILALRNDYLSDVAEHDSEGGIRFFDSVAQVEAVIRDRVHRGTVRRRYDYSRIKHVHSQGVEQAVAQEIMPI